MQAASSPIFAETDEVTTIGFHASHEQFNPRELLACVRLAETAGFERITARTTSIHGARRKGNQASFGRGLALPWPSPPSGSAISLCQPRVAVSSGCARTGWCDPRRNVPGSALDGAR